MYDCSKILLLLYVLTTLV